MIDIEQIKQNKDNHIIIKNIEVKNLFDDVYDIYVEVFNEYKMYKYSKETIIAKIKNLENNIINDTIIIKTKFLLEEIEIEKQNTAKLFTEHTEEKLKQEILSKFTPNFVLFNKIEKIFYTLYQNNKTEMIMFILVKLPNSFTYDQLKEMEFEELNKIHSNLVKYLKVN